MKILCISDQVDPFVYSTALKQRFGDVDLVVSAGDLPMEYLSFVVSCLNKPLLFVFGNHNLSGIDYFSKPSRLPFLDESGKTNEPPEEWYTGATHIGSKSHRECGLIFVGLGGSMRYSKGENQFTDLQMRLKIFFLLPRLLFNRVFYGRFLDVLVTHAPPRGIHDKNDKCHQGFPAFLWFIRVFKPRFLIHGHIHLYDLNDVRTTKNGSTLIINAFSHYIIDTEECN